jgi:hypothetical protein
MINPYFCYCLSFAIALALYPLGWSELYPPLSLTLAGFLLLTIVFHLIVGWWFSRKGFVSFKALSSESLNVHILATIFIYLLWTSDFIYEGGIPLIKILLKQPYNYRLFGIPSLHVFIVTFSSFYTVYLAHVFVSRKNKLILTLYLINLMAAILIYSRAMFVFNLAASMMIFLLSLRKVSKPVIVALPFCLVILAYIFGVLGTLRVSREEKTEYRNEHFLKIGAASPGFSKSTVPKEFFWTYIYMTSPLANLQTNINSFNVPEPSVSRAVDFINNEIFMDFISKRVNGLLLKEREAEKTLPGPFNVSTVYSRSYSYLGWPGILLMAIIVMVLPLCYKWAVPSSSPFFITGLSILSTMFLFLAYDNTIRFTGLSFQLIYPILLTILVKKVPAAKAQFA